MDPNTPPSQVDTNIPIQTTEEIDLNQINLMKDGIAKRHNEQDTIFTIAKVIFTFSILLMAGYFVWLTLLAKK
jgi:hypothetical protein